MLIDHVIGGKYRITELIGQGGMGTVFEAVHNGTGARVAIKLIVSSDIKEEVFVRFQREARAAGTIDSQHIVRIFDMGTDERSGSPYMVMERLSGEDLSQLMRRLGPLPPPIAVSIGAQAALGLAKAHEKGVIHRDIKPANLFLHDGGDRGEVVVKLLDFGIAKVLMDTMQRSEEGGLTRTGSMLGSPHYMSPEQAQGLRTIDHRADVWSLGVVLYKMLSGQTPHAHLTTLGQVILAICSQPARPIQELAPWVPPEVALVVHRALQPDPGRRYQTAYEMFTALQGAVHSLPPIRRGELQPLSHEQRMHVAPSAFRPDVPTNGTQNGMTQTPRVAAPSTKNGAIVIALVAAGVLGAVGLAGIGAAVVARRRAAAQPTLASTSSTAAGATATPSTGASQAGPTAPAERTVTLAVSPPNAIVEVDGVPREAVQGVVELKGPIGTVLSVHLSANNTETTQSIVITEGGAIPPRLAITAPAMPATTAAARPRPAGGTGSASGKPPSPTGTALNAQRTFE